MEFDYKKHSLKKLETWVRDSLTNSKATPQEIYDTIKGVVNEEYHCFKYHTGRCYELLALLNGNGEHALSDVLQERDYYEGWDSGLDSKSPLICDNDDTSEECKKSWTSFWEENYYPEEYQGKDINVDDCMPPWGHSDMEYLSNLNYPEPNQPVYTEEELNAMCEKAESDQEKEKCREYNLREAEYYDKRAKIDTNYDEMIAAGYEMTADGFWIKEWIKEAKEAKEDKVIKWQLPIEVDGLTGECYVQFPDDLLEAANLKEGDKVTWIDNGDGSYKMIKVTQPLGMDEC